MTHDYSEYRELPGDNLMAQINAAAQAQKEAEAQVARLEEELKTAKNNLKDISEHQLPALMDAAGLKEFTTREGIKISVAETIRGSIPPATAAQAYRWLEEHDHGDLIKRQFSIDFDRDQEEWAQEFEKSLSDQQLRYDLKRSVHASTLCAFVREQLAEGVDIPLSLFGVYRQRHTKVKT